MNRSTDFRIIDAISRRPETNTRIITFQPTPRPEDRRNYINPTRSSLVRLHRVLTAYQFDVDQPESIMATTQKTLATGNPWTAFVYR